MARSGSFRTLALAGLALVGVVASLGVGATAAGASIGPSPAPPPDPSTSSFDQPAVILVAVTGLEWHDVRTLSTPALWELSRSGSVGTVAARSVRPASCPADGWLALSAGTRAADAQVEEGTCRTLAEPALDRPIPGWADYTEAVDGQPYAARLGLFGDTLASAGIPVTGIGPGAAIATADGDGYPVGTYLRRAATPAELEQAVRDALGDSQIGRAHV